MSTHGRIRTPDLLIRSQTLYPAELRAHKGFISNKINKNRQKNGPGITPVLSDTSDRFPILIRTVLRAHKGDSQMTTFKQASSSKYPMFTNPEYCCPIEI